MIVKGRSYELFQKQGYFHRVSDLLLWSSGRGRWMNAATGSPLGYG